MSTVSPAEGSKYFGRRKQELHELSDQQGQAQGPGAVVSATPYSQNQGQGDHFDLTDEAKEALKQVRQQFQEIFNEYPEFQSLFPQSLENQGGSDVRSGLAYLAQARRFLNDPVNTYRSQQQPEFGGFFQKIQDLASHHAAVISKTQRDMRRNPAGTYSHLRS